MCQFLGIYCIPDLSCLSNGSRLHRLRNNRALVHWHRWVYLLKSQNKFIFLLSVPYYLRPTRCIPKFAVYKRWEVFASSIDHPWKGIRSWTRQKISVYRRRAMRRSCYALISRGIKAGFSGLSSEILWSRNDPVWWLSKVVVTIKPTLLKRRREW